jgi:hypothetical protein
MKKYFYAATAILLGLAIQVSYFHQAKANETSWSKAEFTKSDINTALVHMDNSYFDTSLLLSRIIELKMQVIMGARRKIEVNIPLSNHEKIGNINLLDEGMLNVSLNDDGIKLEIKQIASEVEVQSAIQAIERFYQKMYRFRKQLNEGIKQLRIAARYPSPYQKLEEAFQLNLKAANQSLSMSNNMPPRDFEKRVQAFVGLEMGTFGLAGLALVSSAPVSVLVVPTVGLVGEFLVAQAHDEAQEALETSLDEANTYHSNVLYGVMIAKRELRIVKGQY